VAASTLAGEREPLGRGLRDEIADQRRTGDDEREWQRKEKDADECEERQPDQRCGLEPATCDPHQSLDHDHQHRGLDAEQRAVDHRDAASERIEQAQAQHHERARQHDRMPATSPPRTPCTSQPM
jgi:hypothetical protein